MKTSTAKTDKGSDHLSRNPNQFVLQENGATPKQVEKFKYLEVAFTSDGRQDQELNTRIGKPSAVMCLMSQQTCFFSKKAQICQKFLLLRRPLDVINRHDISCDAISWCKIN